MLQPGPIRTSNRNLVQSESFAHPAVQVLGVCLNIAKCKAWWPTQDAYGEFLAELKHGCPSKVLS